MIIDRGNRKNQILIVKGGMKLKNCAIYTRVSTDMQAEIEYNSCESQEEKILSFINSQDTMQVYKTYSDPGYSGGSINRPALQELLCDVQQKKLDLILSYKIDRLTRSPKDFYLLIELFEKFGVDFISVTERFDTSTPSGMLLRNIMLMFADYERSLSRERTRDKMLQRAEHGIWNGGTVPYGYRSIDKKLAVEETEAKIVKFIYQQYIETGSLTKVHNMIREQDIKYKDKKFHIDTLSFLLRNNMYSGKINYAGKTYDGVHEPIISENLFNTAQTIHKKRAKRFKSYKQLPFAGIIRCKECDMAMSPDYTNKHSKGEMRRYFYYRCLTTGKEGWDKCNTKQVNADRLEKFVIEYFEKLYNDYKYLEYTVFKINHDLEAAGRISPELRRAELLYSPEIVKNILFSLLNGLKGKKGIARSSHIRDYIKKIIYSPQEIEIHLFYDPDFSFSNSNSLNSYDNKKALSLNYSAVGTEKNFQGKTNKKCNNSTILNRNSGGGSQTSVNNFTDYLNSSYSEVVANLRFNISSFFQYE